MTYLDELLDIQARAEVAPDSNHLLIRLLKVLVNREREAHLNPRLWRHRLPEYLQGKLAK